MVSSLVRQIGLWESGARFPRDWADAYAAVFATTVEELFGSDAEFEPVSKHDDSEAAMAEVVDLANWLEQTNVGDGAISYFQTATRRLSFDYARQPPLAVMREVRVLQGQVASLLRNGRQRIAQTQALLEVSAELFALVNLLAGDVGRYPLADAYGYAAWTCAQEADSDTARALVLCA